MKIGIGLYGGAQLGFGGGFGVHQGFVFHSAEAALVGLQPVFDPEYVVAGEAGMLGRLRGIVAQHAVAARQQIDHEGDLHLPEEVQLGHGELTLGSAGIAGDEDQVARARAGWRPGKIFGQVRRLSVLIDAEKSAVEIVARIFEVVVVAAEEGHLRLGGKDQADVGEFLVPVKVVDSAAVKRDHIAAQAGFGGALLFNG